jgi:F-type H+-transporting ATPase subunit gamma
MPAGKEIKERIKSVKNTGKITKAMELISTVKMKKAQERVQSARPFAQLAATVFAQLWDITPKKPFARANKDLIVVIASQKGLCGSYNIGSYKQIVQLLSQESSEHLDFVTLGKKGREFLLRTGQNIVADFSQELQVQGNGYGFTKSVAKSLMRLYASGSYRSIRVISSYYVSAIKQIPVIQQMYPLSKERITEYFTTIGISLKQSTHKNYTLEPSRAAIRDQVLPLIFDALFRETFLEAQASEHAARMVAMKNAKDAANKKVSALTLSFNKARQGAITKEVSEIVSGVESMKEI